MMIPSSRTVLGETMRTRTTAAALAAGLLLAGCSSGTPEKITVTVTKTVTAAPGAPSAAAPSDGVLKMGAARVVKEPKNKLHFTVQAIAYQQPYKGPQPQPPQDFQGGDTWATAEVKVCNVKGIDLTVSQFPWSLSYTDGTSIDTTGSTGGDMPKPELPMGKIVKPGRCVKGLVAFPVPGDKRPERLVYQPESASALTEWAIPQS